MTRVLRDSVEFVKERLAALGAPVGPEISAVVIVGYRRDDGSGAYLHLSSTPPKVTASVMASVALSLATGTAILRTEDSA